MAGESNTVPDDLLKQTFFTKDKNEDMNKVEKHGFNKKLRELLNQNKDWQEIITYLKGLSPSGVELEFISLATFEISEKDPNASIEKMLRILYQAISSN